MKLHFMKGKRSSSDLQVAVLGWENKGIGTVRDKEVLWKVDTEKMVLCIIHVCLRY